MIERNGLTLPDKCPACHKRAATESFSHEGFFGPHFLTVAYECGARVTRQYLPEDTADQILIGQCCERSFETLFEKVKP